MIDRIEAFRRLHVPGKPLILYNVWDAGSARAVAAAGAPALATASWSVAAAHGYADGEQIPRDLAIANLRRIVAAVELPVSVDLESGYGAEPSTVAETVARAAAAGAVGCNLEDGIAGGGGHYGIADQSRRLRAAREAASLFVNARVDLFLDSDRSQHASLFDEALERALAYAGAGVDGIFVPGLTDEALIRRFCESSPRPVNIMKSADAPELERLSELGVARISYGPEAYRQCTATLSEAAAALFG